MADANRTCMYEELLTNRSRAPGLGRAKLQLSGYRRSEGVRAGRWREACAVSCRHSLDRHHGHGFGLRPDRNSDIVTTAAVNIGRPLGRVGRDVVLLFCEVFATAH